PSQCRCLTEALLYRDFGLKIQLPSDRLCPPDNPLRGINIGTGGSTIYPLLGCAMEKSWNFVASGTFVARSFPWVSNISE
ncbi:hypothetical protein GYMLUDRAFT_161381, partial [Collybiopsis luxurians FD-317 M1]